LIDTSELIERVRQPGAKKVALQFPEGLKREAPGLASRLKEAGFEVVVSGDPCYGACDLAIGLLNKVDLLIHFGHSPVDGTLHVLYEPVGMNFDIPLLDLAIPFLHSKKIGIVTTIQHVALVPAICAYLEKKGISCCVAGGGPRAPENGQVLGCSYGAARDCGCTEILYVGTGMFHPMGVQLAMGARVIAFDPFSRVAEVVSTERFLRRRFALIEKAKNARNYGIILSLKSGQERWSLAKRLSHLHEHAIIVAMQEVHPDELLNLGFSCYINTACPRLAYDDQERFPVPVLSPGEFEIVCGVRNFEDYRIDEIT